MSTTPRAAIFDMDGLMLDTERIAIDCWLDAARALGLEFPESVALGMVGMHIGKAPAYLSAHFGNDFPVQALLAATHERYMAATARPIPLKPHLLPLLDWLEDVGLPKVVATSTRRSIAEHHLAAVDILGRFRLLVCGDEITHPKPDPEIYLKAASLLDVPPQACVVFEDSNFGVAAAHAAGCRVIMVPDLKPPTADILALGVSVVPSLAEARALAASWLT